jgi:hypothetical protein
MAQSGDRPPGSEKDELRREMEMIEREGGGAGESAPLRRLAFVALAALVIFLAFRFLSR